MKTKKPKICPGDNYLNELYNRMCNIRNQITPISVQTILNPLELEKARMNFQM